MGLRDVKKRLMHRRAELVGDIDDRNDEIAAVTTEDEEDKQFERLDDEVLAALTQGDRDEIARIEAALERIDAGSYGICQSCEQPIAAKRLEALPDAVLCIDCASQSER